MCMHWCQFLLLVLFALPCFCLFLFSRRLRSLCLRRVSLPPDEKPETFEAYVNRRMQHSFAPSASASATATATSDAQRPAVPVALPASLSPSHSHARSQSLSGEALSAAAGLGAGARAAQLGPSLSSTAAATSSAAVAAAQQRARTLSRGDELAPNPDTKPLPSSSS